MSAGSKKSVSRRELFALTGGALGAATLGTTAVVGAAQVAKVKGERKPSLPAGEAVVGGTQPSAPAGAWVAPAEQPAGRQFKAQALPLASADTLAAFGGLQSGSVVDRWTVEAIHEVHLGGIPVVLKDAQGNRFQVDVLARDASVRAVAETQALSFFVVNAGNGSAATAEEQGLAAMALAAVVERRGASSRPVGLLGLTDRQARFAGGDFRLLA